MLGTHLDQALDDRVIALNAADAHDSFLFWDFGNCGNLSVECKQPCTVTNSRQLALEAVLIVKMETVVMSLTIASMHRTITTSALSTGNSPRSISLELEEKSVLVSQAHGCSLLMMMLST